MPYPAPTNNSLHLCNSSHIYFKCCQIFRQIWESSFSNLLLLYKYIFMRDRIMAFSVTVKLPQKIIIFCTSTNLGECLDIEDGRS